MNNKIATNTNFKKLNYSCAQLLACAVKQLYPETKFAASSATEEGFYHDFEFQTSLSEKDLAKIERRMLKIVSGAHAITSTKVTRGDAKKALTGQNYSLQILDKIPSHQEIIFIKLHNFSNLCDNPHVASTKELRHCKLLSLAGAYWGGDSKNVQLTRIYGFCAATKLDLEKHLEILKERQERDHRRIGQKLKLFTFNQLAGQGLPIWLPAGMTIYRQIQDYVREVEFSYDFQEVSTPLLGEVELYKTSGHWQHYRDDMFPTLKTEHEELVLRPMACPHHHLVYQQEIRSYRDLPLRLCEQVIQHRYEASGALTGLERVRMMTLTDSHIYCAADHVEEEIRRTYELVQEVLQTFKITIDHVSLSLRDSVKNKYFENDKLWNKAEAILKHTLQKAKINHVNVPGEAAFYGPKIDIQIKTALGHIITVSTIQLDLMAASRFGLTYRDSAGTEAAPIVIHRGLIGTYERFIAILLEQTKGVLPLWLAPVQVVIIPVLPDKHGEAAKKLHHQLRQLRIRATLDERNERLGYRIREAQNQKTPFTIVVGDKEVDGAHVTYRQFGSKVLKTIGFVEFQNLLLDTISKRT